MMGITTGAITGVINRMERMGYAQREKDANDGRRVIIRPVPEELGRVGADVFGSYEKRALDAVISEYDDRDLAIVLNLMRRSNSMTERDRQDPGSIGR
jgi:DNA-binding MarR family transcriptional regulator